MTAPQANRLLVEWHHDVVETLIDIVSKENYNNSARDYSIHTLTNIMDKFGCLIPKIATTLDIKAGNKKKTSNITQLSYMSKLKAVTNKSNLNQYPLMQLINQIILIVLQIIDNALLLLSASNSNFNTFLLSFLSCIENVVHYYFKHIDNSLKSIIVTALVEWIKYCNNSIGAHSDNINNGNNTDENKTDDKCIQVFSKCIEILHQIFEKDCKLILAFVCHNGPSVLLQVGIKFKFDMMNNREIDDKIKCNILNLFGYCVLQCNWVARYLCKDIVGICLTILKNTVFKHSNDLFSSACQLLSVFVQNSTQHCADCFDFDSLQILIEILDNNNNNKINALETKEAKDKEQHSEQFNLSDLNVKRFVFVI